MHRARHLLVALSHSAADAGLLEYAAEVGRSGAATEIHFVHVLPQGGQLAAAPDRVRAELQASVERHFPPGTSGPRLSVTVLSGALIDQLLIYAAEQGIDLLFVGHSRGHSGSRALARRLAMKAPCSIWMVPDNSPSRLRRLLVPVDFSEPAADAMRVALALARQSGAAECLALHVFFNEARATFEEYDEILRGQEEQAYRQFMQTIDCHGVRVTPLFREAAHMGRIINQVAQEENVDLVVMATRGRSRSAAILLGSVTEETIIETRVSLLVVKHFGARMSVLQALLDRRFLGRSGPQTD